MARVIAFEGVDGAGKSTVLKIVAEHLQAQGLPICLPRLGKEHDSRPLRAIRRLTRDRTNLELHPRAEALLFAAREAQVLEQFVRPAIARGQTVLLDRSMLTSVVLGAFGRGLDLSTCEAIASSAGAGLAPDLTLVFDVDPRTSRIRKRLDKIRNRPPRDSGRKGLAGSGFKQRIREGYLEIAERDGFPVIHAERSGPEQIAACVIELLDSGRLEQDPADAQPWFQIDPGLSFAEAVVALPELVQLYFTRRMDIGRELRAAAYERETPLVVYSLDLTDPLIPRAAAEHPELVLSRFSGDPAYHELRERNVEVCPDAVARSLVNLGDATADALRERLCAAAPGAVLESLTGRSDALAVALRERLWKQGDIYERCLSIARCDDADAWRRREKLLDKDPALVLPGLAGLEPARVDVILDEFAAHAPKQVLRALKGRSDEHAHALRSDLLETGREVVDSIIGLDDPESWALRERCLNRWASTVALSLMGLDHDPRTADMLARCREAAPDDLFLARRLHQVAQSRSAS